MGLLGRLQDLFATTRSSVRTYRRHWAAEQHCFELRQARGGRPRVGFSSNQLQPEVGDGAGKAHEPHHEEEDIVATPALLRLTTLFRTHC